MELKDVSWAMEHATLVLLNGLGSSVYIQINITRP
jgi:hypothetical protein